MKKNLSFLTLQIFCLSLVADNAFYIYGNKHSTSRAEIERDWGSFND